MGRRRPAWLTAVGDHQKIATSGRWLGTFRGAGAFADVHESACPVIRPDPIAGSGRVGEGCAGDFESFFKARYEAMERALVVAVASVELGRDATAEGFTRAFERWSDVSGYGNPAGWVFRVGLNWARSHQRKRQREVRLVDGVADGVARHLEGADAAAVSDDRMVVLEAVALLSDEHREVIVARWLLDLGEAEAAEALSIRVGTVKSRASRAMARLAELVEER